MALRLYAEYEIYMETPLGVFASKEEAEKKIEELKNGNGENIEGADMILKDDVAGETWLFTDKWEPIEDV